MSGDEAIGDQKTVEACKAAYETWKGDCSGFVKAVGLKLGIVLTGNADAIVAALASSWTKTDRASCVDWALRGRLVIAGLASKKHTPARNNGHVVVIVGGERYRGLYPMCWGGSIGSAQSPGTKSVGEVWNKTDRDNVVYYYK